MTKPEIASLFALLKEYYPRDIENTDIKTRVAAWEYVLKDYSYEQGKAAVVAFVSTDQKGFSPSVGQLVEQIHKFTAHDTELDELAAWDMVCKAVKSASMHPSSRRLPDQRTSAERNFDALPLEVQSVVHSPSQLADWAQIEPDTFNTVTQSNFLRSYRARRQSDREYAKLPEVVKNVVKQIVGNKRLELEAANDEADN